MRDELDNGDAEVLVLLAGQGRLATDTLLLPGGVTADVFDDDEGNTLVQVDAGRVSGGELLRAVVRSPGFRATAQVLDVVIVRAGGYDRHVLSADLEHRFLFTRQWDAREQRGAPTVAVVGRAPLDPENPAARRWLAATVGLLRTEVGEPATIHVLEVFTRRADDSPVAGLPDDRRPDRRVRAETLAASDAVVASWGVVPPAGLWAVDETVEELRVCRERGARVLVRAEGGDVDTVGDPPQPTAHPTVGADSRLVEAPSDWLWGAPLT